MVPQAASLNRISFSPNALTPLVATKPSRSNNLVLASFSWPTRTTRLSGRIGKGKGGLGTADSGGLAKSAGVPVTYDNISLNASSARPLPR